MLRNKKLKTKWQNINTGTNITEYTLEKGKLNQLKQGCVYITNTIHKVI